MNFNTIRYDTIWYYMKSKSYTFYKWQVAGTRTGKAVRGMWYDSYVGSDVEVLSFKFKFLSLSFKLNQVFAHANN